MGKARDEALMAEALRLASRACGRTYPNPAVGAVVVRGRCVVGRGYHRRCGAPHAEIVALGEAGPRARGAELFVTLEPCNHYGRTPPCTEAIVAAGIGRVHVAAIDPNPLVRGRGVRFLRKAGVDVRVGLQGDAARKLNESYFKLMRTGRPFVTLKIAETVDGKIADADGDSKWITSPASRALVKAMRRRCQAILVGVGTVMRDDPTLLPARGGQGPYARCVLDSGLRIPPDSRLVRTAARRKTIVYFNHDRKKKRQLLEKYGVTCVKIGPATARGVAVDGVLDDLGRRGVQDLIVEGGAHVFTSFVRGGHVDKVVVFIAPGIMGGTRSLSPFLDIGAKSPEGVRFRVDDVSTVSRDVVITLYPRVTREGTRGR